MANIPEISLQPDVLFTIGNIEISNAILTSFLIVLIILGISLWVKSSIKPIPGKAQVAIEMLVSYFYLKLVDIYGSRKVARKQTALILGLFIYILISNQFALIPIFQSLQLNGTPMFKPPTTHLSQTLALSLVVVALSHGLAIKESPIRHLKNYLPIDALKIKAPKDLGGLALALFLWILDIIGELGKIVSLSARLFGNVFAGEVMILVITGLSIYTMYIIPLPFYFLGILSGVIQALVFAFLAMSFISGSVKAVQIEEPEPELVT